MALAEIYDEYVSSLADERELADGRERDPLRLYVTDVGKCKLAVALRMLEAERRPVTAQQRAMWYLAERIELTLADALDARNELLGYQERIDISDRDNWGGRLDIVRLVDGMVQIVEVKTVRSNAFRFSTRPQREHIWQVSTYDHYFDYERLCGERFPATGKTSPVLWYADRGGANTPEEYVVETAFDEVVPMMDELDAVRSNLPALPPMLPRGYRLSERGGVVREVPDWRCRMCEYQGISCAQDMSERVVMRRANGVWSVMPLADTEAIHRWAEEEAHRAIMEATE